MSTRKLFIHPVRVYIEDTDAGGIVYHPNYLKFFERARTEMLRECGFTKTILESKHQRLFVIKDTEINFKKPSFMDDMLEVRTFLESHTPVRLYFFQEIYRSQMLIASAKMTVVSVNKTYRPAPFPILLLENLTGKKTA